MVSYSIRKSPPLLSILSQIHPLTPLKKYFKIFLPSTLMSPKCALYLRFRNQNSVFTSPFPHRLCKTYTTNESKELCFMDVGLNTRVARSSRLMAFVVSGVVKANEGRTVNPSSPPTPTHGNETVLLYTKMIWPRPTTQLYSEFDLCGLDEGKNAAGNIRLFHCVAEVRLVSSCLKLLCRKILVVSVNCEWSDVKKHQEMWENSTEGGLPW